MNASISSRFLCFAALSLLGIGACAKKDSEPSEQPPTDSSTQALVADGNEAIASSSQSSTFGSDVVSVISSQAPEQAASELAAPTKVWPAGCVTRTKDATNPLVIHVAYDDCTGPFGLIHIVGQETVTLSEGAGGALHIDFRSEELTANGHPLSHSASADVLVDGTSRNVTYDGSYTRQTEGGVTVSHTSKLSLLVDAASRCVTANGSAQTEVGTFEVDSTMKDYEVCSSGGAIQCPMGTVTHTAASSGRSITVDFDGTDEARVTGPNDNTFDVALVCGQGQ